MSKTLIINYSFPPNPGVGGRRWAKFCKYFARDQQDFIVITKTLDDGTSTSKWYDDVKEFRDKIRFFDFNYPKVLERSDFSFFDKINYRVQLRKVKLLTKGNFYDRISLSQNKFKTYCSNLITTENISTVIVSVAPFGLAKSLIGLKKEFPQVKFVVDFRDPWIDNKTSYGMESLSKERQQNEIQAEAAVIASFDKVVSVSEVMTNNFRNRYSTESTDKFVTIVNGFDEEDVIKEPYLESDDKIHLVFMGTFYEKAKHHLPSFSRQLLHIKQKNPTLYGRISISFYGTKPFNTFGIEDAVKFHAAVAIDQVSSILSKSDIGLLFLSDDINYSFSTKFCEYIAHKLPIVVLSKPGKTGEYIEENNLGIELNEICNQDKLFSLLSNIEQYKSQVRDFDSSDFNIESLSSRYQKLIN